MAITLVRNANMAAFSSSTSSFNLSVNCVGGDLLSVAVYVKDSGVTSVTFDGVAMSLVATLTLSGDTAKIYHLVAPNQVTANVVVTKTTAFGHAIAGAMVLTGVDQVSPVNAVASASGSGAAPSISVVNGASNAWLHSVFGGGYQAWTVGSGTQNWNVQDSGADQGCVSQRIENAAIGPVALSWTNAGTREWIGVGASYKPSGASGTGSYLSFSEDANTATGYAIALRPEVFGDAQSSELERVSGSTGYYGPIVRGSGTYDVFTGYIAYWDSPAAKIKLAKYVAGNISTTAPTAIAEVAMNLGADEVLKLSVNGTSLSVYVDDVLVIGPSTDSAIASGAPGIFASGATDAVGTVKYDNWRGGDEGYA